MRDEMTDMEGILKNEILTNEIKENEVDRIRVKLKEIEDIIVSIIE